MEKKLKVYYAVCKDGDEVLFDMKAPQRNYEKGSWQTGLIVGISVLIPGTIERLFGRKLTFEDGYIEVDGDFSKVKLVNPQQTEEEIVL